MTRNLFNVCLLALAIGYASAEAPERIVGGHATDISEYPHTVSLRVNDNHFCGGAIIGHRHILTAGHCVAAVQDLVAEGIVYAVAGTTYLDRGGVEYKVVNMWTHPKYQPQRYGAWHYDIGVVKVAEPIKYTNVIQPIALPTMEPPAHIHPTISAWGRTSGTKRTDVSNFLKSVELRTLTLEECQKVHGKDIIKEMICTLEKFGVGTCSGDSGSPLIWKRMIIGVVSGGIPCAVGYPDIFTNVYRTLPFINEKLAL